MKAFLMPSLDFMRQVFEGEGALNAAILFNSLILFGFLLRFYRYNIAPIKAKNRHAAYWKNAWNLITFAILFLIFGAFLDVLKFADIELFFGADMAKNIFDAGFLSLLGAGIHMIKKRFS